MATDDIVVNVVVAAAGVVVKSKLVDAVVIDVFVLLFEFDGKPVLAILATDGIVENVVVSRGSALILKLVVTALTAAVNCLL